MKALPEGLEACCGSQEFDAGFKAMAERKNDIRFLRQSAQKFRELARRHQTPISPRLREIADELDKTADALENEED